MIFKQLLQAEAIDVLQIDACRVAGVNENIAILLLAAKFGIPVCPHAGGVGLCELVQHLSMFDYVAVSGTIDDRVIEYVDHLHEHFVDPVLIRDGAYLAPSSPGCRRRSCARPRSTTPTPTVPPGGHDMEFTGSARSSPAGLRHRARHRTLLTERGANVACLDLDDPPAPLIGVRADVRDDAAVRAAVAQAVEHLGGLDILVNNAGIGAQGTVEDNADDEWHGVLDVNVVGMVRVSPGGPAAPAPLGARRDRQHLLDRGHRRPAPAGALLRDQGRRAVAHPGDGRGPRPRRHPGQLRQPGHRGHALGQPAARRGADPEAERAALEARQPMGRLVSAEEVAAAIAYLAGPLASATTGTALAVDGGMDGPATSPREILRGRDEANDARGRCRVRGGRDDIVAALLATALSGGDAGQAGASASTTPGPTPTSGTPTSSTSRSTASELAVSTSRPPTPRTTSPS